MTEQGSEAENPGQAIYDALSDEAKAAVDALPDDVFGGPGGMDAVQRFVESVKMAHAINPEGWLISPDSRTGGRDILSLIVSGTRLVHVWQRRFLAVRYDDDLLDESSREWILEGKFKTEAVLKTWPNLHRVHIPFLEIAGAPAGLWTAHEAAARALDHPEWEYHRASGGEGWHKDAWRIKLRLITGEALPVPTYMPAERYGLALPGDPDCLSSSEEAMADGLSNDQRAALLALPDDLFQDASGVDHTERFAEAIRVVHDGNPAIWSLLSSEPTQPFTALNVQDLNVISLSDQLRFVVRRDLVDAEQLSESIDSYISYEGYSKFPSLVQVAVDRETPEGDFDELWRVHRALLENLGSANWAQNAQFKKRRDDVRAFLAQQTAIDVSAPSYVPTNRRGTQRWLKEGPIDSGGSRSRSTTDITSFLKLQFAVAGLAYTPQQIASFYTALQTKEFVILSGISGTGKSKIAQRFAAMLPDAVIENTGHLGDLTFRLNYAPYMKEKGYIYLQKAIADELPVPKEGVGYTINMSVAGEQGTARLATREAPTRGTSITPHRRLQNVIKSIDVPSFHLRVKPTADGTQIEHIGIVTDAVARSDGASVAPNHLFLPVRPDWRDGKALIGYHNPLAGNYVRTDFLNFVIAAGDDWHAGNRNAFFVILDEMNLAHVEYYFADVLSVIESGRDEDGWTVEGIKLGERAEESGLPAELLLPPNLFIVGTVNMDETTHPFSPKVLDRAFTIDLTEVDFTDYPPEPPVQSETDLREEERQALLRAFTRNGRYARIDKGEIRAVVELLPGFRDALATLNRGLERYRMHFGYRVFDEIMQFVHNAENNGLFASVEDAFDHAVLMKVLPKFNGSRAKLENALFELLHWTRTDGAISSDARSKIESRLDKLSDERQPFASLVVTGTGSIEDDWRYPATGRRAALMMQDLYTDGFASFG